MPKRCTRRQRDKVGRGRRARRGLIHTALHDTRMTTEYRDRKLAREMLASSCTGRWVLEQETSEQLDRFRRRCAAFSQRRRLGKFGPPPRKAPEGATDDRYCGPAIDAESPSRTRARPQPSRTEGMVRKLEEREGAVLLRRRRHRGQRRGLAIRQRPLSRAARRRMDRCA